MANSDCAFYLGSTHEVCEDYGVAGEAVLPGSGEASDYAIISDGCSSSKDSDIGARLIVKAAECLMIGNALSNPGELHSTAAAIALEQARMIGLDRTAVDATLITVQTFDTRFVAAITGDGVIGYKRRGESLAFRAVSFPSGYPFYPSYIHQIDRVCEQLRKEPWLKRITECDVERDTLLYQRDLLAPASPTEIFSGSMDEYEFVVVTTDGSDSFYDTEVGETRHQTVSMPQSKAISRLLAFKSFGGSFVTRRLKRMMRDRELTNRDDIAVGAIHF
jgi:hypothetical protein